MLTSDPQEEDAKNFTHVANQMPWASLPFMASEDNRTDLAITPSTSAAHNTILNPKISEFVKMG